MFEYNQLMSIALIAFGSFFLLAGKGRIFNRSLSLLALLMPIAGFLSELSISEILMHIAIGFGGLIVGLLYYTFVIKRGGLLKAFAVVVLWLPFEYLVPTIISLLIVGFVIILIDDLINKVSQSQFFTDHFTAILMIFAGIITSPILKIPIIY